MDLWIGSGKDSINATSHSESSRSIDFSFIGEGGTLNFRTVSMSLYEINVYVFEW